MGDALLLAAAVLLTSTLSGVFGMGGGMLLMGVLVWVLPVRDAMVLHGVTQLAANGSRFLLLRRHVHTPVLARYAAGAVAAALLLAAWRVVPPREVVLVLLGAAPLAAALVPAGRGPSIESPRAAAACGAVATAAQMTAGVSGPLLDAFFVRTSLDRHAVIATKAVTQTLGHALKLLYFGALVEADGAAPAGWTVPLVVACALGGTWAGGRLLDRLDEDRFRRASRGIVITLSIVFLVRGLV